MAQITLVPSSPTVTAPSDTIAFYQGLVTSWIAGMQRFGREIFGALAALEIAWFCVSTAIHHRGNMSIALMLAAQKIIVLGVFLSLLLYAPTWLPAIVNTFPIIGRKVSGVTAIAPSAIIAIGINLAGALVVVAAKAALLLDLPAALSFLIASLGIVLAFTILTIQYVVTVIETLLAIGIGFIFAGFGGSRWTVPYVERYFAFAVSAGIKLMVLYLFVGAGMRLASSWQIQASKISYTTFSIDLAWETMAGVFVYVGVCWFTSKIAGAVLGGSPSLSGSDAVGLIAAAIGAGAAGAAVISGVGAPLAAGAAGGAAAVGGASASGAGTAAGATGAIAPAAGAATGAAPAQAAAPVAAAGASASGGGAPAYAAAPGGGSASNGGVGSSGSLTRGASAAASAMKGMPHGGGQVSGPRLNGFSHE